MPPLDWQRTTADVESLQLVTLNVRHFPMFEDLQPPFAAR
jgi:hypothetical protein